MQAYHSKWKNRNLGGGEPLLPKTNIAHTKLGTVFVLHFDRPYQHATHYTGWTDLPLFERIEQLKRGHASPLLAAVIKAGIGWRLARTWENVTRQKELSLKRSGSASRYCPVCAAARIESGVGRRRYPTPAVSPAPEGGV